MCSIQNHLVRLIVSDTDSTVHFFHFTSDPHPLCKIRKDRPATDKLGWGVLLCGLKTRTTKINSHPLSNSSVDISFSFLSSSFYSQNKAFSAVFYMAT